MILNVSGRTDIIGFYSEWFFKRLKAGFVDVRNPFNPQFVSRYSLKKEDVDILVITTKNPLPLLSHLDMLSDYTCLFQITLTPYGKDLEPRVPDKNQIISAISHLTEAFGPEHIWLRFDPILLNERYTTEEHAKALEYILDKLAPDISRVIISFVDEYKNTLAHHIHALSESEMHSVGKVLGQIGAKYHMPIQTCSETVDLSPYGIYPGLCVDPVYLAKLAGHPLAYEPNQQKRPCACADWRDIGAYNSCLHFCRYCYANFDEKKIRSNYASHDPESTMLIGHLEETDIVREYIPKNRQLSLF